MLHPVTSSRPYRPSLPQPRPSGHTLSTVESINRTKKKKATAEATINKRTTYATTRIGAARVGDFALACVVLQKLSYTLRGLSTPGSPWSLCCCRCSKHTSENRLREHIANLYAPACNREKLAATKMLHQHWNTEPIRERQNKHSILVKLRPTQMAYRADRNISPHRIVGFMYGYWNSRFITVSLARMISY